MLTNFAGCARLLLRCASRGWKSLVAEETTCRLARLHFMPRKHDPDLLDWLGATDEQAGPITEQTLRSMEWVCTECRVVFYSDIPIVPPRECDFCGCCYFETEKAE